MYIFLLENSPADILFLHLSLTLLQSSREEEYATEFFPVWIILGAISSYAGRFLIELQQREFENI